MRATNRTKEGSEGTVMEEMAEDTADTVGADRA